MKHLFYTFLCMVAFTSCRSIGSLSIDYMEPATVSFPAEVRAVAVVNNVRPDDWHLRVQQMNQASNPDQAELGMVESDGLQATEALAHAVADGNYFDTVLICDSALRSADRFGRDVRLGKHEVAALAESFRADVLFSLEKVQVFFRKGLTLDRELEMPLQFVDGHVRAVVRVYLPGREAPLATVNAVDSLYWLGTWQVDTAMVHEAVQVVAGKAVRHLLPTWQAVERYFYAGENVYMRDAAVCLREGSWAEARRLWQKVYAQGNPKNRMRAAFNLALYYEMNDNLHEAIRWVQQAMQLAEARHLDAEKNNPDYKLIANYRQALADRVEQLAKLQLQMQRFERDF